MKAEGSDIHAPQIAVDGVGLRRIRQLDAPGERAFHENRRAVDRPQLKEDLIMESIKLNKTPAQVILRWHTQMGFAVIPGSRNVDHIRDNLDILDFTLTGDEMAEIASLNKGRRYYVRTDEALAGFAGWQPAYEAE